MVISVQAFVFAMVFLGVISVPTFVLFENGNKVRATVGAMPKAKFVDWLNG